MNGIKKGILIFCVWSSFFIGAMEEECDEDDCINRAIKIVGFIFKHNTPKNRKKVTSLVAQCVGRYILVSGQRGYLCADCAIATSCGGLCYLCVTQCPITVGTAILCCAACGACYTSEICKGYCDAKKTESKIKKAPSNHEMS